MRIRVTWEDIVTGCRGEPNSCPVALAVHRSFPKSKVTVAHGQIRVGHRRIPMPQCVQDFINWFDELNVVKPFSFNLKIK